MCNPIMNRCRSGFLEREHGLGFVPLVFRNGGEIKKGLDDRSPDFLSQRFLRENALIRPSATFSRTREKQFRPPFDIGRLDTRLFARSHAKTGTRQALGWPLVASPALREKVAGTAG